MAYYESKIMNVFNDNDMLNDNIELGFEIISSVMKNIV